jgi:hypothetical protein
MTLGPWPLTRSPCEELSLVAIRFYCLNFADSSW